MRVILQIIHLFNSIQTKICAANLLQYTLQKQTKMIVTEYRQLHEYHFHYITYQIINTAKKGLSLRKVLFI